MNISTADKIVEMAKAGYPALYLLTAEDIRAQREVKAATDKLDRRLFIWTLGKGVIEDKLKAQVIGETESPNGLLDWLPKMPAKSVVVLRLFHHFLEDPLVQSRFLDLLPDYKNATQRMLCITAPTQKLPPEIEKEVALVELKLPDKEAIGQVLDGIIQGSGLKGDKVPTEELRKQLIANASGMTTTEAENALSLSLIRGKATGKVWDAGVVLEEKCAVLQKTGLLEFKPTEHFGMDVVGGMKPFKAWAQRRARAWTKEAREFGIEEPKGVLLVGIAGTGKSLVAKALGQAWKIPLLRLDMGKIFGSLVGQSEANVRMAIQVAEAVAPCILWIDELEKGLAGTGAGGSQDSGVGARVLGTLLTWMQEKTSEVFVCATANDVRALPPELLRKGRFDEMFSVLLPNAEERREIFGIHLKKRKREKFIGKVVNLEQLASRSEGYSGAEIEAAVKEALVAAFDAGRELTQMDIVDAIDNIQPLSKTMSEMVAFMEEWCKGRTRPANGDESVAGLPAPTPSAISGAGGRMVEA